MDISVLKRALLCPLCFNLITLIQAAWEEETLLPLSHFYEKKETWLLHSLRLFLELH